MAGISEINISEKIAALKDGEAADFINRLKLFAEDFPATENCIKNAFEKKDKTCFSKCIEAVRDTLSQICPGDLALECDKLISLSADMNHEETEAQMTHLLSLLTMLSIDIQMAVYRKENAYCEQYEFCPQNAQCADCSNESAHNGQDKIILAVDDNPFFLTALKNAMSGTDYKLICVSLCSAALNFLEKQKPNLFILDIEMPEMNGYELAEKIREKGADAPIIFMTGNSAKEYVLKAIEAGASDFIVKPILQEYVLAKIRKFI